MNAPHWHLALNHLPVVGMLFATGLLALALGRKSEELLRTAFALFAVVALAAVPVYLTGEPAEMAIMDGPGFEETLANTHEQAATFAFTATLVLGAAALATLLVFRKAPALPRWCRFFVLGLALVTTALLGWTANLGGKISHPEVRDDAAHAEGERRAGAGP